MEEKKFFKLTYSNIISRQQSTVGACALDREKAKNVYYIKIENNYTLLDWIDECSEEEYLALPTRYDEECL
jgi:hypothetical protein